MEELENLKDNTKDAYDIRNYDLVYILLKPGSISNSFYSDFIRFDKRRNRYFLTGKIIELENLNRYHSMPFIPEKNIIDFKKAKMYKDKEKFILNISFGDIDFINLPFDSLDWRK